MITAALSARYDTVWVPEYLREFVDTKARVPVTVRVWKARFAGPNAGTLVVSIEYPNLAALAKNDEAMRSNADLTAAMKRIGAIRKIVSDSIYEEQTP